MFIVDPAYLPTVYVASLVYALLIEAEWDLQSQYPSIFRKIWTMIYFSYLSWIHYIVIQKLHRLKHLEEAYNDPDTSGMDGASKEAICKQLVGLRAVKVEFKRWPMDWKIDTFLQWLFKPTVHFNCNKCRTTTTEKVIAVACASNATEQVKTEAHEGPSMAAFAKKLEQESMAARQKDLERTEE